MRIILQNLLLFSLPFLGYFLFMLIKSKGQFFLKSTPWYVLSICGLVLASVSMIAWGLLDRMPPPDGIYIPATYKDGKIVPGHYVDP